MYTQGHHNPFSRSTKIFTKTKGKSNYKYSKFHNEIFEFFFWSRYVTYHMFLLYKIFVSFNKI